MPNLDCATSGRYPSVPEMPHFRITLAYDGTDFVGWQRQSSGTSIQGLIEDVLGALDGQPVSVAGAGRTDAGVHALGQVASFSLRRPLGVDAIVGALNARLPDAVRVLEAKEVEPGFHARFSARAKHYRYRIWNARVMQPQERRYAWHVPVPLDVHAMAAAARLLEGHHDLAAFRSAGGAAGRTERIISRSEVHGGDQLQAVPADSLLVYEIQADGFLRHMVRAIVGSLVEVGLGRRSVEWVGEVVRSRDRRQAGPTAPARGLVLVGVRYDLVALTAEPESVRSRI
jgi:tRNA pseudouridine38-40 synthase